MAKLPKTPIEFEILRLAGTWGKGGNPLAAWRAFHLARVNGIDVPLNVAAEIDRFAAEVTAPFDGRDKTVTKNLVAAAWGVTRGKKPVVELRNELRASDIYYAYWQFRRGEHPKKADQKLAHGEALEALADAFSKSVKTIEEILTDQFKKNGDIDPHDQPSSHWS